MALRSLLVFLAGFALVAACGGRSTGIGSDGGGGSSDAGNSGDVTTGSSGGGSSGGRGESGSDGTTSSGSDASGGGDGGSSGGADGATSGCDGGTSISSDGGDADSGCAPLDGCCSDTECPGPGGCNTCYCQNGTWACGYLGCVSDNVADAAGAGCSGPDPDSTGGFHCSDEGLACTWTQPSGCDVHCYCVSTTDMWHCTSSTCGGPPCPAIPPVSYTACNPSHPLCDYPVVGGVCGTYECSCSVYGSWDCYQTDCIDGGASPGGCPASQPASSSACSEDGQVCAYEGACTTNCLCSNGAWDCADESPCE